MLPICLTRLKRDTGKPPTTMKITLFMLIVIALVIKCIVGEPAVEVKSGRKARLIRPRGW